MISLAELAINAAMYWDDKAAIHQSIFCAHDTTHLLLQVRDWDDITKLPGQLQQRLLTVLKGRDAVFDPKDPVPFLALHYLQMTLALLRVVQKGTPWLKLDLCSGKVVELGGD